MLVYHEIEVLILDDFPPENFPFRARKVLVGNWKDETFLQKKSFDLVLADYLLLGVCGLSWCCRCRFFLHCLGFVVRVNFTSRNELLMPAQSFIPDLDVFCSSCQAEGRLSMQ